MQDIQHYQADQSQGCIASTCSWIGNVHLWTSHLFCQMCVVLLLSYKSYFYIISLWHKHNSSFHLLFCLSGAMSISFWSYFWCHGTYVDSGCETWWPSRSPPVSLHSSEWIMCDVKQVSSWTTEPPQREKLWDQQKRRNQWPNIRGQVIRQRPAAWNLMGAEVAVCGCVGGVFFMQHTLVHIHTRSLGQPNSASTNCTEASSQHRAQKCKLNPPTLSFTL